MTSYILAKCHICHIFWQMSYQMSYIFIILVLKNLVFTQICLFSFWLQEWTHIWWKIPHFLCFPQVSNFLRPQPPPPYFLGQKKITWCTNRGSLSNPIRGIYSSTIFDFFPPLTYFPSEFFPQGVWGQNIPDSQK